MAIIGSCPSDKFNDLIGKWEQDGFGYHMAIMKASNIMKFMNIPAGKACEILHDASGLVDRRNLQTNEIENAVQYVYDQPSDMFQGEHFVKEQPSMDKDLIARVGEAGSIDELRSESSDIPGIGINILTKLYSDSDIIHIAEDVFMGKQKAIDQWTSMGLDKMQYICPNPLKKAEESRVMMNIKERRYMVFESDIPELESNWDAQAGVINKLRTILDLKMVVWSGNKSLHAWFDCRNQAESQIHRFNNMAIKLGADQLTLRMTQLVRMPWGKRDNGKIQKVIFYHG